MTLANQISEQLNAFLANELSFRSLMEWLTRNIWNADTKDARARKLAADIELIVAEFSAHHIDQPELRSQLERLLLKRPLKVNLKTAPQTTKYKPSQQAK